MTHLHPSLKEVCHRQKDGKTKGRAWGTTKGQAKENRCAGGGKGRGWQRWALAYCGANAIGGRVATPTAPGRADGVARPASQIKRLGDEGQPSRNRVSSAPHNSAPIPGKEEGVTSVLPNTNQSLFWGKNQSVTSPGGRNPRGI